MSAFAAIFRRTQEPNLADGERMSALRSMTDRLAHRGGQTAGTLVEGRFALGHVGRWVTPEEADETQPVREGDRALLFDGRLDNRDELISGLGARAELGGLSDAQLVLRAFAEWGEECCGRFIGPFAFVLADFARDACLLVRDPLGDRTLFYTDLGDEVVVASEEASLLAHPRLSRQLHEPRLVEYFAGQVPWDGSTFFEGVHELRPACYMRADASPAETVRYWNPPEPGGSASGPERELAEEYRHLLGLAVESRLRGVAGAAVLMSGGLDSTSLAAVSGGRVGVVSWVFERFPSSDERAYIDSVVESLGLESRQFVGDDLGPSPNSGGLCLNPSSPEENPYRRLKASAYGAATTWGRTVLLSGGSADALYTGFERWVRDLATAESWAGAVSELLGDLTKSGARTSLRRAGLGRPRRSGPPAWLTDEAAAAWRDPSTDSGFLADPRVSAVAGTRPARSLSLETFHAASAGVDLRHPYRDRRLIEFMLSLPAYELYRHSRFKEIARRAMAGRLPEEVLARTDPTRLTPIFEDSMRGAVREGWRRLLHADDAVWPRFVRRDWVEAALERPAGPAGDVTLWNCVAFELWRRRFSR